MGIYLPNMEIPRDGQMLVIFPDGTSYVCFNGMRERLAQTKAVPVPPHGRLIDADVLMKEFEKAQRTMEQHGQEYSCSFLSSSQEISTEWYCVEDMVENAPTIIPPSGGKEDE